MEVIACLIIILLVLYIQNYIFIRYSLQDLEYNCQFSVEEANEGDEIMLIETLFNNKRLPLPWLKVEIFTSKWLEFANSNSVVANETRFVTSGFFLWGFQRTTRHWKVKCLKRGYYTIDNVAFVSGDVFGKYTSSCVKVNSKLIVYPSVLSQENTENLQNLILGDTVVRRWINDDPFLTSGIREYYPGDALNKIDWKATSKMGEIFVKKNDYTSKSDINVLLNMQTTEFENTYVAFSEMAEHGIRLAATIVKNSYEAGNPVRFCTNGKVADVEEEYIFTRINSGRGHILDIFEIMAKLELKTSIYFEELVKEVAHTLVNSDVVIITAYLNEQINKMLYSLHSNNNNIRILATNLDIDYSNLPKDVEIYFSLGDDK